MHTPQTMTKALLIYPIPNYQFRYNPSVHVMFAFLFRLILHSWLYFITGVISLNGLNTNSSFHFLFHAPYIPTYPVLTLPYIKGLRPTNDRRCLAPLRIPKILYSFIWINMSSPGIVWHVAPLICCKLLGGSLLWLYIPHEVATSSSLTHSRRCSLACRKKTNSMLWPQEVHAGHMHMCHSSGPPYKFKKEVVVTTKGMTTLSRHLPTSLPGCWHDSESLVQRAMPPSSRGPTGGKAACGMNVQLRPPETGRAMFVQIL